MSNAYLVHHGILGQKWGVRRYQNEDGTWTSAGKARYGDDTPDGNSYSEKKSSAGKTVLKVGAVVAGTALAAYGAYKLYDSGALSNVSSKGQAFTTEELKSMGLNAFEPDTIKINTVEPDLIHLTLDSDGDSSSYIQKAVSGLSKLKSAASSSAGSTDALDNFTKDLMNMNMKDLKDLELW